jgi:drug/metabolite transporter (DMT)-like permease
MNAETELTVKKSWLDNPRHADLTALTAILCWAIGFLIFKEVLLHFDPLIAAWGRMFFGLCMYCLVFNRWLLRIARQVKPKHWLVYLFTAFCEPCLYLIFTSFGIKYTTVSQAAVMAACTPVIVTLLAWLIIKEKPGRYALPGFFVVIVAIVALNFTAMGTSSAYAPNPVLGNGLLLIAAVCSAGYLIALRHFSMPYPMMFSAAIQAAVGSIFILPVIYFSPTPWPTEWPLQPTFLMVMSGVVTTFGVYILFNMCIPKMPLARLTSFVNMLPVFTIALSILIMGEVLTPLQLICCAVIILGVIVSQRDKHLLPRFKK